MTSAEVGQPMEALIAADLARPIADLAAQFIDHPSGWVQLDGAVLARLAAHVCDEATVRKAERERLAAWFEAHADDLRALASDGLSVESIAFLVRVNHDE